ncbi:M20 family metallopeptidase [Spirochaetota bacterium]
MLPSFDLLKQANAMRSWLVEIRRSIHKNPEPGLEEYKTAALVEKLLSELDIEYERNGTAIVGIVRGTGHGKTVALRADMDALPIQEENEVEYKSQRPGFMHACGHDAHTAILIGAAKLFSGLRSSLAGNIKLFFQPAEESTGGAENMIKDGCLENPRVDHVLGLHVQPYLPVGKIEIKKGAVNGSSTSLHFFVRGKSCHAAYPEQGIDAIMIAGHLITALHSLVSRYVSPLESAVLSIGRINGGSRSNILADEVNMVATLRTSSNSIRDMLVEKVKALADGISAGFGGTAQINVEYGYIALVNDDRVVDIVVDSARQLLGLDSVAWKEKPSMGVEDFSYFARERPSAFYNLGCGNPARGIAAVPHSPRFDIDEDCLPIGVAIQAAAALSLLQQ